MTKLMRREWLPMEPYNEISVLKQQIAAEDNFAPDGDKTNMRIMERKLKRLEAK